MGRQCYHYIDGAGTNFVTEFWLDTTGVPVKENQQLKGKQGFTVTTFYSDWKVGEPPASLFVVPPSCKKNGDAGNEIGSRQDSRKRAMRDLLRQAMRERRAQLRV